MASNSNITLPVGTTDHGQPGLLCLPTAWTDIVVFFIGNYVAHAATIRLEPGTSIVDTVLAIIWALLIPVSGVQRGVRGILSFAKFGKTDLQIAARAGALCQVIRTDLQARTLRERLLTLGSGEGKPYAEEAVLTISKARFLQEKSTAGFASPEVSGLLLYHETRIVWAMTQMSQSLCRLVTLSSRFLSL